MEYQAMAHLDHELLNQLPLGLVQIDADGCIGFVSEQAGNLLGNDAAGLTGKRPAELNAALQRLLESDPVLYHDIGGQRWIRRQQLRGGDGRRLIVLDDVTEQERLAADNSRLQQQVEDLKLTDELTGLPNRRAIGQALDLHVSRSRRYQNPLSILMVSVDLQGLARVRPLSTNPAVLAVSRFLRDRLRWVDQIGRWEDDEFLLVLPETSVDDARLLIDKIIAEQTSMQLPEPFEDVRPQLAFGLACWSKGDDMRTLLRRAHQELRDSDTD
jgi:diguanylate cyclase (GGDEF)-like protein